MNSPTPWNGGLIAINSFGFGGANAHLLLRSNPKPKMSKSTLNPLPNIFTASGTTESAVNKMLDKVAEHSDDQDLLALVRQIHSKNIVGHGYRGYQILNNVDTVRDVGKVSSEKRPIW